MVAQWRCRKPQAVLRVVKVVEFRFGDNEWSSKGAGPALSERALAFAEICSTPCPRCRCWKAHCKCQSWRRILVLPRPIAGSFVRAACLRWPQWLTFARDCEARPADCKRIRCTTEQQCRCSGTDDDVGSLEPRYQKIAADYSAGGARPGASAQSAGPKNPQRRGAKGATT